MSNTDSQLIAKKIQFLYENTDFALTLFKHLVGYAVFAVDFDGNIIAFNRGAELIYGCTAEEVVGKERIEEFLPCKFTETWESQGIKALLNEGRFSCEIEMPRKNGESFSAQLMFTMTKDSGGKTIGFVLIVQDLTERKLAEQARLLQQIAERYKMLVETSPDVLMLLDAKMIIIICSSRPGAELFGYTDSPKDIVGKHFHKYLDPHTLQQFKDDISNIEKIGIIRSSEYLFVRKDGTTFTGETSISVFMDTEGHPACYIVVVRDITERKEAEKALRENEEKFRSIYEGSNDAIMLLTDKGFFDCNKRTLEIFGLTSKEEFVSMHPSQLSSPLQPDGRDSFTVVNEAIATAFEQGLNRFEWIHRRKSGEDFPAEVLLSAFNYQGKRVLQATVRDISERKQAEESIRNSYAKLRRTLEKTAVALSSALEMRDAYTAGHQRRVTQLACAIAKEIGISENQIEGIRIAGILHDIGKISVPAEILSKPGKLNKLEFELIKSHVNAGYELLKNIEFPWPIAQMVLQHHEKIDGSGYPLEISGDKILIESRILCVADTVEAMASHRPYRVSLGIDAALEEISQKTGVLYDAPVVDACIKLFKEKGFKFE